MLSAAGMQTGIVVSYDKTLKKNTSQRYVNGKFSEYIDIDGKSNTKIESEDKSLYVKPIDQYIKRNRDGSYTVTNLYARNTDGLSLFLMMLKLREVTVSTVYGVH